MENLTKKERYMTRNTALDIIDEAAEFFDEHYMEYKECNPELYDKMEHLLCGLSDAWEGFYHEGLGYCIWDLDGESVSKYLEYMQAKEEAEEVLARIAI